MDFTKFLTQTYSKITLHQRSSAHRISSDETRNAWQSLAYSPLGVVVSPPSEYLKIHPITDHCSA